MANKRTVQLVVGQEVVDVTIVRHHWSRQLSLSVSREGRVRLSVPMRTSWLVAEGFLKRSREWVGSQLAKTPKLEHTEPTAAERKQARQLVMRKLEQWQPIVGSNAKAIRIGNQRSRWGSCSARGTLSFSWRIIKLPEDLADYLIVHELAHLLQANHSSKFWAEVELALPDYRLRQRALRLWSHGTLTEP